jgi:hypothetical protein
MKRASATSYNAQHLKANLISLETKMAKEEETR